MTHRSVGRVTKCVGHLLSANRVGTSVFYDATSPAIQFQIHSLRNMTPTRQLLPRISTLTSISPRRTSTQLQLRRLTPLNRNFQTHPSKPDTPLPITAHGPPPQAPLPALSQISEYRAKQKANVLRAKKFWKEVHVVETPGPSPSPLSSSHPH